MKKLIGLFLLLSQLAIASDAVIPNDTLKLGRSATGNKVIELNIGSGSANPKLRWNQSDSALQFSNDGSTFSDFGSGSGSGGGFNVLDNPDFEGGITNWSNSGGTFVQVTSGANKLFGRGSATFDASATSQYIESDEYDVPQGLMGNACLARILYKGGDANLVLRVLDDSDVVIAESTLAAATSVTPAAIPFLCPTSGTIRLRIASTANAALIALDRMHLGENTLTSLSQANFVGSISYTAGGSCTKFTASTNTPIGLTADNSGCTYVLEGSAQAPTAPDTLTVKFPSLAPGHYLVIFQGTLGRTTDASTAIWSFSDGVNIFGNTNLFDMASGSSTSGITGSITYNTAQGATEFSLNGYDNGSGSTETYVPVNIAGGAKISVYRFPTQSELAVKAETINWLVDAKLAGASNVSLGTSTQAADSPIAGALALTNPSYAIPAEIACDGVNPPTGTTCGGTEQVGIAFTIPASQKVRVCASFTHYVQTTNGSVEESFQLVETPIDDDSTILQAPSTTATSSMNNAAAYVVTHPVTLCSVFNFSSAGKKMIRLFHESSIAGTIADNTIVVDESIQSRSINFQAYPITQTVPAPIFAGSVGSASSGTMHINRARMETTCSSSPCAITYESGNWLTSITRSGVGTYTLNFETGAFTSEPTCVYSAWVSGSPAYIVPSGDLPSTSSATIGCVTDAGVLTDCDQWEILCFGDK